MREAGGEIEVEHYNKAGAIAEALNRDAENAYGELQTERKQATARRIFQRLVEPAAEDEETRRPARLSDIAKVCLAGEPDVRDVIAPFRRRGFLMLNEDPDPLVDISHESLIRKWKRLKEWVRREVQSAGVYKRLAEAALQGLELYTGPSLAIARKWEREETPNEHWAMRYTEAGVFARAIRFLRRSERRQILIRSVYAVAAAAAVVAAIAFFLLYRTADEQKCIADSRALAASS